MARRYKDKSYRKRGWFLERFASCLSFDALLDIEYRGLENPLSLSNKCLSWNADNGDFELSSLFSISAEDIECKDSIYVHRSVHYFPPETF